MNIFCNCCVLLTCEMFITFFVWLLKTFISDCSRFLLSILRILLLLLLSKARDGVLFPLLELHNLFSLCFFSSFYENWLVILVACYSLLIAFCLVMGCTRCLLCVIDWFVTRAKLYTKSILQSQV